MRLSHHACPGQQVLTTTSIEPLRTFVFHRIAVATCSDAWLLQDILAQLGKYRHTLFDTVNSFASSLRLLVHRMHPFVTLSRAEADVG